MAVSSHSHTRGAGKGTKAARDEAAVLSAAGHPTDRDRELTRLVARHRVLTTDQLAARVREHHHRQAPPRGPRAPGRAEPVPAAPRDRLRALAPRPRPHPRGPPRPGRPRREKMVADSPRGPAALPGTLSAARAHDRRIVVLRRPGAARPRAWRRGTPEVGRRRASLRLPIRPQPRTRPAHRRARRLAQDGTDITFLLEYDTGTEHLPQLTAKLHGYAENVRTNLALTMPLLFCFLTPPAASNRPQGPRRHRCVA